MTLEKISAILRLIMHVLRILNMRRGGTYMIRMRHYVTLKILQPPSPLRNASNFTVTLFRHIRDPYVPSISYVFRINKVNVLLKIFACGAPLRGYSVFLILK